MSLKPFIKPPSRLIEYINTPFGPRIKAYIDAPGKSSTLFDHLDADKLMGSRYGIARPYSVEDSYPGAFYISDDGKGGFRPCNLAIVTRVQITLEGGDTIAGRKLQLFAHKGKFPKPEKIGEFLREHADSGFLNASANEPVDMSKEDMIAAISEYYKDQFRQDYLKYNNPLKPDYHSNVKA